MGEESGIGVHRQHCRECGATFTRGMGRAARKIELSATRTGRKKIHGGEATSTCGRAPQVCVGEEKMGLAGDIESVYPIVGSR